MITNILNNIAPLAVACAIMWETTHQIPNQPLNQPFNQAVKDFQFVRNALEPTVTDLRESATELLLDVLNTT